MDGNCATRDPVKSLCDQYVFNTIITRSCSLVVAIGNPFRLMHIESKIADSTSEVSKNCWQAFFYHCLQCNSLVLSKELNSKRQEAAEVALQQSTQLVQIENLLFDQATLALKEVHQHRILAIQDSILNAYREKSLSRDGNKDLILTRKKKDDLSWSLWDDLESKESSAVGHGLITCRLWQVTYHTCTAVPVNPSGGGPVTISGLKNRRCAFNGALVGVKILDEKQRCGKVCSLLEQVSVQPQICVVDKYSAKLFVPVDNKSPRLKNMSRIARHVLSEKKGIFDQRSIENEKHEQKYVVCFDPSHLMRPNEIPKISHLIPKEVARLLVFVVYPVRWDANRPHPLGAVVAVLPKGITELYANRVLAIQHFVPEPESDVELKWARHPTTKQVGTTCTDKAIGIVSKEGYCSFALTVQEQKDKYVVGFHVCNVADVIGHSEEFIEHNFTRWAGMFGDCQGGTVYHPTLPKKEVQALSFTCDAAQNAITFNVRVSATGLAEHVASGEILERIMDLKVEPSGFEETTVKCSLMLDWSELESLLLSLFSASRHRLTNEGLVTKLKSSPLPVWNMLAVLYAVADELCWHRQGHRGYPELQQSQESFRYPEAWKVVHELVIQASRQAAEKIGVIFCSKIPLLAQLSPNDDCVKTIAENYFTSPFFQWLNSDSDTKPHKETRDVRCTRHLYEELTQSVNLSVSTLRQLLMQPHHHPQLGVVESLIREALPAERFVVKRITFKAKKAKKRSTSTLIENAGGKHHSLQAVIAPYCSPFDSIFDIYVQDLLLKAVRHQDVSEDATTDEPSQEGSLHAVARFCNMAVANARSYQLCMTSLDVAVYAQQSSICVEAFVKEMDGGNIRLCYPDPTLSNIKSLQAIRTRLVTKSDKAKDMIYSTKVTCVTEPCHILKDLKYTLQPNALEDEVQTPVMIVYYHKGCHMAKCSLVPVYTSATVALSCVAWQSAIEYINSLQKDRQTADQLFGDILEEHGEEKSDGEMIKEPSAKQDPSDDEIRLAPFGIFRLPFSFAQFQVVKVWLQTDMNEYVLTPKPQLIELNPDVRICLEHNSQVESCFTRTSHVESSKSRYSFRDNYFKVWEEIVLAEAAVHSVRDTEQLLFTDFQLNFSGFTIPPDCRNEEYYEPVGEIWSILPQKFLANRQDLFPIEQGYFACIRFDVTVEDPALLDRHKHLYPRATDSHVRTVMHMVVDHVLKVEDEETKEVRMTLEEEVIKSDLKVCFDYIFC